MRLVGAVNKNKIRPYLLAAFLFFCVDVRVRARTVIEPHACWQKGQVKCAVLVERNVERILLPEAELNAAPGASFVRGEDHKIQLVRGRFYVRSGIDTLRLGTLFGEIVVVSGAALIDVDDGRVRFTNLSAQLNYIARGEGPAHELPQGFSNYLSVVSTTGVAMAGYPHPAEVQALVNSWSQFYTRSQLNTFVSELNQFQVAWRKAAEMTGPWYVEVVDREIAMQKAEEARLARLKAEQEKENSQYRNMMLKRLFEP